MESGVAAVLVNPKALLFDTFGTVVDWRGSIVEEGKAGAKPRKSISIGQVSRTDGGRIRAVNGRKSEKANFPGRSWTISIESYSTNS
jgi:hypothetical protein